MTQDCAHMDSQVKALQDEIEGLKAQIALQDNSEKPTLFTIDGCDHCDIVKEQFSEAIEDGSIEVKKCDIEGTPEEKANCDIALDHPKFDGFPLIFSKDGDKLL